MPMDWRREARRALREYPKAKKRGDKRIVRAIRYQADFSYNTGAGLVVEDVKSQATFTREYELKKKLLRERFGIDVTEVV